MKMIDEETIDGVGRGKRLQGEPATPQLKKTRSIQARKKGNGVASAEGDHGAIVSRWNIERVLRQLFSVQML